MRKLTVDIAEALVPPRFPGIPEYWDDELDRRIMCAYVVEYHRYGRLPTQDLIASRCLLGSSTISRRVLVLAGGPTREDRVIYPKPYLEPVEGALYRPTAHYDDVSELYAEALSKAGL